MRYCVWNRDPLPAAAREERGRLLGFYAVMSGVVLNWRDDTQRFYFQVDRGYRAFAD